MRPLSYHRSAWILSVAARPIGQRPLIGLGKTRCYRGTGNKGDWSERWRTANGVVSETVIRLGSSRRRRQLIYGSLSEDWVGLGVHHAHEEGLNEYLFRTEERGSRLKKVPQIHFQWIQLKTDAIRDRKT